MKNNINYLKKHIKQFHYSIMVILVCSTSCNSVFEDVPHMGVVTPEMLWNNVDYVQFYVNSQYQVLPGWDQLTTCTEEAGTEFLDGFLKAVDWNSMSGYPGNTWDYVGVRKINEFFEKIDEYHAPFESKQKEYLKGQMYFLRSFVYYRMVRTNGGVPIIKEVQDESLDVTVLMTARNTTLECFDYIIENLDEAIKLLPEYKTEGYEKGRITKGAAMAFKAQVLLLKASPLFCKIKNMEYWNDAYNAAKTAKEELDKEGYGLYDDGTKKATENWWYDKVGAEKEMIIYLKYRYPLKTNSHQPAQRPISVSSGAWKANNPTWELVKAFPMNNGKAITNSSSGYDETMFWKNRDPRFYSTIVYNGAIYGFGEDATRRQWVFLGKIDGWRQSTITGFYSRKGIDTTLNQTNFTNQAFDWPIMRYAEVLLDLAECANEIDIHRSEATNLLIELRKRAKILSGDGRYGLPDDFGSDYDITLKTIMTERQIEFAYEGKRFWDLRRRRMFNELNEMKAQHAYGPILNMTEVLSLGLPNIDENSSSDNVSIALTKAINDNTLSMSVDELIKKVTIFNLEPCDLTSNVIINIPDHFYFAPIHPDNIKKDNKLVQNIGWDDGTFDPLISQ